MLDRLGDLIEFVERDGQRGHDDDHVAKRTQQHAPPPGVLAHLPAAPLAPVEGGLRGAVGNQLHGRDQAALADAADVRQPRQPPKVLFQSRNLGRQAGQHPLRFEYFQRSQRGGRRQGVAAVRVPVKELF